MEINAIPNKIYEIREQKAMHDRDLVVLYEVENSTLNDDINMDVDMIYSMYIVKGVIRSERM